ncbi:MULTISPECIES: 4-hydroxylaminobenzoate lyase [unclassified Cupriavidus]|uniref:4-hydroxylaminobenzoate lyase n=1 Tax=unclassified Cupriavidus TaxID=2640874 RepID=UPI00313D7AE6
MTADILNNDREALIERCIPFLEEVKDITTNSDIERWLNEKYGPGSELYQTLSRLIRKGVEDGWAANVEIDGPKYRRSRIAEPTARTLHFSITAVYMDSTDNQQGHPDRRFRGQYHGHPYGEFNMVVPLNQGAFLNGPDGWRAEGWTAPAPGSHHYPEAKGGAVIALFFLPSGRISYHPAPQE